MADTTTPVTPPAQDLQINLEDAPKAEIQPATGDLPPDTNLDLDLNLPEAPKSDDRLKAEDQKNAVTETTPVVETPVVETPVVETKPEEIPVSTPEATPTPVIETPVAEVQPEIGNLQPVTEIEQPSTKIEEVTTGNLGPATGDNLKEDMNIINDLESHESAGGLAPEANVEIQPTPVAEVPKTFDLDAMLGPVNTPTPVTEVQPVMPPVIEATPMPVQAEIPQMMPTFTIPTTTSETPVSAVTQVKIPQSKTKGVKTLLFVVLFAALGFTTYFILKTMYPVEFGNILGGDTQMHASEELTGATELTGTELITGTTEELTGTELTGTEDNGFGELNDLGGTPVIEEELPQTDLSRLTDYVNKGNELLEQGKVINNNTVIKYGLYISKKATDFLEKIAIGEEISNLSGYFAQFDQYIVQLETLLGTNTTPPAEEPMIDEGTSSFPETTDGFQDMTPAPEATTE